MVPKIYRDLSALEGWMGGELNGQHENNSPKDGELNGRHENSSPKGWMAQK